jgi:RNA polymerase sigma-32 factor
VGFRRRRATGRRGAEAGLPPEAGELRQDAGGQGKYIFENRLTAEEPKTLQEIGTHFGVSRERARQIEAALISRMRDYVKSEMPDFDLVAEPKG